MRALGGTEQSPAVPRAVSPAGPPAPTWARRGGGRRSEEAAAAGGVRAVVAGGVRGLPQRPPWGRGAGAAAGKESPALPPRLFFVFCLAEFSLFKILLLLFFYFIIYFFSPRVRKAPWLSDPNRAVT